MYETTVANANLYNTNSSFVFSNFWLRIFKRKISKITLTCIITAVVGIILMLGSSLTPGQMTGNLVAFIMPISFAILILIVRKYPKVDMIPLQLVAGIFATLIGLFMSPSILVSTNDIFLGFYCRIFSSWTWIYTYNNWSKINSFSICWNHYVN